MAKPECRWESPQDWAEWSEWLAGGLHGRHRWRLPVLLTGILFARGRRTVTTWLRAAGISTDYADYYYFLAALGRKTESVATRLLVLVLRNVPLPQRLLAVIDDSPTKRYGPKVEGADIHHNPTPGPADQTYLYGHIWVTLSLTVRHPLWGALALPLRAFLYVRQKTLAKIPRKRGWKFAGEEKVSGTVVMLFRSALGTKCGFQSQPMHGLLAPRIVAEGTPSQHASSHGLQFGLGLSSVHKFQPG
jgi:hypothetical protein